MVLSHLNVGGWSRQVGRCSAVCRVSESVTLAMDCMLFSWSEAYQIRESRVGLEVGSSEGLIETLTTALECLCQYEHSWSGRTERSKKV